MSPAWRSWREERGSPRPSCQLCCHLPSHRRLHVRLWDHELFFFFAYRQLKGGRTGIPLGPNNPEDVCDGFLHPLCNTAGVWDHFVLQESLLPAESSNSAQRAGRKHAGQPREPCAASTAPGEMGRKAAVVSWVHWRPTPVRH